jgi:hypothetical protein
MGPLDERPEIVIDRWVSPVFLRLDRFEHED